MGRRGARGGRGEVTESQDAQAPRHPPCVRSRSDAILERSVGPWCCRVRACAFRIAALPSGMRVVCVRVRFPPRPPHPLVRAS